MERSRVEMSKALWINVIIQARGKVMKRNSWLQLHVWVMEGKELEYGWISDLGD